MVSNLNQIKKFMLNEYELGINAILNDYFSKDIELSDCINLINDFNKNWEISRVDFKYNDVDNKIDFLEYEKTTRRVFNTDDENEYNCKLESRTPDSVVMFKILKEDNLKISFRTKDFDDENYKELNSCIVINEFSFNKEVPLKENILVCQDKHHVFEKHCESDELILISYKFKTIFDYFPPLKFNLNVYTNDKEINYLYEKINQYIEKEIKMF